MQPLLTAAQTREADAFTITNEQITSIELMERAANAFVDWFITQYPDRDRKIAVYCGTGNNGGDGLVIARLFGNYHYEAIVVKIAWFSEKVSADFKYNLEKIKQTPVPVTKIKPGEDFPVEDAGLIIDALLGSGLNKPLEGDYKKLVDHINNLKKRVVAVDVPTGFLTEGEIKRDAVMLKADVVVTFQQPKINFLLPESAPVIKTWEAVDIGINKEFISSLQSPYLLVEEEDVRKKIKPRHRFSNKGTYGHALIVAGKPETMGAAIISAAGCAYAGAGLTTACVPQSGLTALNSYLPEIMAIVRDGVSLPVIKWNSYNTIGIGPGLGKDESALSLLKNILHNYKKPVVIDADALNLLAENKELLMEIPENSILTPHMKEFDRLFGNHSNWWQRLQTGIKKAGELKLHILLKNDYTMIFTPGGKVYFNPTSNQAMATGGMGDVLTGIIASLLAQQYSPEDACIIGAYLHGKAGDELAMPNRLNVVLPGLLAAQLPATMAKLMA